jgi:hypothetical protein
LVINIDKEVISIDGKTIRQASKMVEGKKQAINPNLFYKE